MADRAAEMIALIRKSEINYEHFFDKLDDPAWVPFLAEHGFFNKPTPPVRGEGWVRFPFWPESRYLVRMAAQAPEAVFKAALGIAKTDNVRVHEDVLRIAAQLPGPQAARLARKEAEWLRGYDGPLMSLPPAGGELIAYLAREGNTDSALGLARALLAVVPAPDAPSASRRRARARIHEWEYGQILERHWPALAHADPRRALRFLCDRLAEVIRIGFTEPDGADYTYVWRSAVESHGQNLGGSLLDVLVDAVRDQALELAISVDGLEVALGELARDEAPLFTRIKLNLLRERGSPGQVAEALADAALVDDHSVWHEYGELLRGRFVDLTAAQREPALELIAGGPDVTLTPALEERGITAADLKREAAHWRLRRYVLIADHLEGPARDQYERLREELGEPEHPTFLTYSTSWTGPTSPYTTDELRQLGVAGVIEELRDWSPSGGPQDPSREGFARILELVVAEEAPAFGERAGDFRGLPGAYVRALIDGLAEAAKTGVRFEWSSVLALCEWAVEQQDSPAGPREDDGEARWTWVRKEIAELLSRGFVASDAQIPLGARERVWALLAVLAEDPDPDPAGPGDEESEFDPATQSINSVRGEALHATLRYILWVERLSEDFAGLASVPEARAVLEHHLDPGVDRAPAIRSVYGQWFPEFVRLDKAWARAVAPRVFPSEGDEAALFAAAWNAYVVFNTAFTDVFPMLGDAYALAIERLGSRAGPRSLAGDSDERLGDHLLSLRISGGTEGDDDLFARYWRAAQTELRRGVLTHTGWSLEQTVKLSHDAQARLQATWEWILTGTAEDDREALAGFGAWLGAHVVDGGWLLAQAQAVLASGIHLEPDFVVYGAAARLADAHPIAAVAVVRGMVETDAEGWSVSGSAAEVREAVTKALGSEDASARIEAEALVELLTARGESGFLDLLTRRG